MGLHSFCLGTGSCLVILGACPLLFVYGFASMTKPHLDGWDHWSLVLSKMFNFADAGWLCLLSSIFVVVGSSLIVWSLSVLVADAVRWCARIWRHDNA
jgi:hypothetical protein